MTRSGSTIRTSRFSKNGRGRHRRPVMVAVATILALGGSAGVVMTEVQSASAGPIFGILKICKVAGPGVPVGTLFRFSVRGMIVTVPAGPGPGGYCQLANSGMSYAGASVDIAETPIPFGDAVTSITTTGPFGPINVGAGTITVGTPNATPLLTVVTYTDAKVPLRHKTGYLEICKTGTPPGPTTVPFTVTGNLNGNPVAVPAHACSPSIPVQGLPIGGTIPVSVTEANGFPIASFSRLPHINGGISCAGRTATVTVTPGGIPSETILLVTDTDVGGGSTACIP